MYFMLSKTIIHYIIYSIRSEYVFHALWTMSRSIISQCIQEENRKYFYHNQTEYLLVYVVSRCRTWSKTDSLKNGNFLSFFNFKYAFMNIFF